MREHLAEVACVAQMSEHCSTNAKVAGSHPATVTTFAMLSHLLYWWRSAVPTRTYTSQAEYLQKFVLSEKFLRQSGGSDKQQLRSLPIELSHER